MTPGEQVVDRVTGEHVIVYDTRTVRSRRGGTQELVRVVDEVDTWDSWRLASDFVTWRRRRDGKWKGA